MPVAYEAIRQLAARYAYYTDAKDIDALFDECTARLEEPIEMYVYNVDSDEVRVAVVMPTAASCEWSQARFSSVATKVMVGTGTGTGDGGSVA